MDGDEPVMPPQKGEYEDTCSLLLHADDGGCSLGWKELCSVHIVFMWLIIYSLELIMFVESALFLLIL